MSEGSTASEDKHTRLHNWPDQKQGTCNGVELLLWLQHLSRAGGQKRSLKMYICLLLTHNVQATADGHSYKITRNCTLSNAVHGTSVVQPQI